MIDTVFHFDSTPVRVSHDHSSDPIGRSEDGLLIRSNDDQPDVLTCVTVGPHGAYRRVYVYWSLVTTGEHFDVLYVPMTETLFLGGGTVSAAISLQSMSLVHQNDVMLFWAFERRRDCILELGEVECFLYDLSGHQIGTVPADPPYDIHESDRGINVVSPIYGSQWLEFPV